MLDPVQSKIRQKRLLQVLHDRKLDAALIGFTKHVYYLTAHLPFWQHSTGLLLFADGQSTLVTANSPNTAAAADSVVAYDATWMGTQRQEQATLVADALLAAVSQRPASRIGYDTSAVTSSVIARLEKECVPLDDAMFQLRRQKDADELKLMKVGIECGKRMYEHARQIIEPGIAELDVFNELHAVAVETAGEPLSDFLGNDFACGAKGGPPRQSRTAKAGQLYILDLGPAYRGYFSDNARAISVDRKPTDAQLRAWEIVTGVHPIIERMARPGVRCRDLFAAADEHYRRSTGNPFPHHLGHGVGLTSHEYPHLNPKWDDVLMEGEVFTVEPGLYRDDLAVGMRIENQYRVTSAGVENLTPFPNGLV
jgi:Xaa-Pro dipeptidase